MIAGAAKMAGGTAGMVDRAGKMADGAVATVEAAAANGVPYGQPNVLLRCVFMGCVF